MDRPYVIINCAASADGKIALPDKRQIRISSDEDFRRVQTLRERCDAVLVGIGTILSDDPRLDAKYSDSSKQPIKVVLDTNLRMPKEAEIFKSGTKVYIISRKGGDLKRKEIENAEIIECEVDSEGLIDLRFALDKLKRRGIKCLLVEGGGRVIWSFLKDGLFDEIFIYISPIVIGGRSSPTIADGDGVENEKDVINLKIDEVKRLGEGILIRYLPCR